MDANLFDQRVARSETTNVAEVMEKECVNGRVAAGIPVTWYVPPPSQNRTWSVTPSGSQ